MALLTELEDKIASLIDGVDKENFIYDFMRELGIPKSTVTKLQKGTKTANMATVPGDIWSNKNVYYRQTSTNVLAEFTDVKSIVDSKQGNTPRIIMVTDFNQLLALDTKTSDTLNIAFNDLPMHFDFFLPWQGIEQVDYEAENPADIKAAERFAKIYDVLFQDNTEIVTVKEGRKTVTKHVFSENTVNETAFNNFLIRALFAFFAEDTDIFPRGSFTNVLKTMIDNDGSNMNAILSELFTVLDQPENTREDLANWLSQFPYINGSLFTEPHEDIVFSAKSRKLIIDAGELIDWTQVNPDIFGSMVQAVTGEDDRSHLGMHYTSVPNIMKVIKPLFLDDLNAEFEAAYDSEKKLNELSDRMSRMKFFDPAAGSGNFLIITYKELRRLEIKVMKRLAELTGSLLYVPIISLKQFYGIEIEEFATDVAKLSLWIAEHQMNVELRHELNGVVRPTLPLQSPGAIVQGNSLRLNWENIVNVKDSETLFIFGNPPYYGSKRQTPEHKADLELLFGDIKGYKLLDYISGWFLLATQLSQKVHAKIAFVTTNSITQGEQVGILWPHLFSYGIHIDFAYQSFLWKNNAKNNAGVSVAIIGLTNRDNPKNKLYSTDGVQLTPISPYLIPGDKTTVRSSTKSLFGLPKLSFGDMPNDGGGLIFTPEEYNQTTLAYPELKNYFRKYVGAEEFIKGAYRYALWISENDYNQLKTNPIVSERLGVVKNHRESSKDKGTNKLALTPWRFRDTNEIRKYGIIIPATSSANRLYIPMGLLDNTYIVSNSGYVIYDGELWMLGLLQSRAHMVWMRSIGGKLKTDYRYSAGVVYNTFPVPKLSSVAKEALESYVLDILDAREEAGGSLAELYKAGSMPDNLRNAHKTLDDFVEKQYKRSGFADDDSLLSYLLNLYKQRVEK